MSYPPPQYPGHPGMPGYPGGVLPPPKPSGGTAITAGVLALLGTLAAIVSAIIAAALLGPTGSSPTRWELWLMLVVLALEVFTLTPGAILLFRHRPAGRLLVITGCALHVALQVVLLVWAAALSEGTAAYTGFTMGPARLLLAFVPAIATLVLAAVPLTGRWCAPPPPVPFDQPPSY